MSTTAPSGSVQGLAIRGTVHGGQQPIQGAHVYVLAAGTTGYGAASVSLLDPMTTGQSDSVGAYVLTDSGGAFSLTGSYKCLSGSQVYLYALGGDPGAGVNLGSGLLAILGQCPAGGDFLASIPFVSINEVSTVAAAYAFSGFAVDATHVSSPATTLAKAGIANAFANSTNLADLASGSALSKTPAGNGVVPQAKINTLANILSSCINSTGPSSSLCVTLFANAGATESGIALPTDTAGAAIDIAHHVGSNLAQLFALSPASPPFAPSLSVQPKDFALGLKLSGGGIAGIPGTLSVAIDGTGNAWLANTLSHNLTELSPLGAPISPASGFTGGGLTAPAAVAIDPIGNVWVMNLFGSLSKFSSSGAALSPIEGYSGGGLVAPSAIAIDGSGDVWLSNSGPGGISEFANSGQPISPLVGYTDRGVLGLGFFGIAIDSMENAWVSLAAGNNLVAELSPSGATLSPGLGYGGGGLDIPHVVALDSAGSVWTANVHGLTKFSSTGVPLSPSPTGFTGQQVLPDSLLVSGLAIDGGGNAWVGLFEGISELSNSGALLFLSNGTITDGANLGARSIAIDGSGDVWVTNELDVLEYIGAGVPVVTPLSVAVKNASIATRP